MQEQGKYAEAFELIRKGYQLQRKGKIRKAIQTYKASIKILPTAEAHTYLGWAFSLLGRYDKAIQECYIAIDIDDEYGNSYNDMGYYLTMFKKYDEALEYLQKALRAPRFEERHWAYYNLGRVYEIKGLWNKAMEYYYQSHQMQPGFSSAKDATLRLQAMMN